jgi:hypothetical protein
MKRFKTVFNTKIEVNFVFFGTSQASVFGFAYFTNDTFFANLQGIRITVALDVIIDLI